MKSSSALNLAEEFNVSSLSLEVLMPVLRDTSALFTVFFAKYEPSSVIVRYNLNQDTNVGINTNYLEFLDFFPVFQNCQKVCGRGGLALLQSLGCGLACVALQMC